MCSTFASVRSKSNGGTGDQADRSKYSHRRNARIGAVHYGDHVTHQIKAFHQLLLVYKFRRTHGGSERAELYREKLVCGGENRRSGDLGRLELQHFNFVLSLEQSLDGASPESVEKGSSAPDIVEVAEECNEEPEERERSYGSHSPVERSEYEQLHPLDGPRVEYESILTMKYLQIGEREVGLHHLGGEGEAGDAEQANHPCLFARDFPLGEEPIDVVNGEIYQEGIKIASEPHLDENGDGALAGNGAGVAIEGGRVTGLGGKEVGNGSGDDRVLEIELH